MKKTNNKGFSLVELIVVIAIMAVLIGVLSPQLLRYVNKARIQRDNQAIAEVANAAKIAMAEESVYSYVDDQTGDKVTLTFTDGTLTLTGGTNLLEEEIKNTVGASVALSSGEYTDATTDASIEVAIDGNKVVTVTGKNMYNNDGTAASDILY